MPKEIIKEIITIHSVSNNMIQDLINDIVQNSTAAKSEQSLIFDESFLQACQEYPDIAQRHEIVISSIDWDLL